ncbi:abc transporter, partial [Lasius niger]
VVNAVGLEAYTNVMANTLSGGNKRKLSLAIALTGNPSVILLDEPSSGLDAASKRIMWRTLGSIIPGRSILLTTHSMEEADALADRAGIMARRMLALGSTESLRRRFGDTLHVHLVSKTAPHSTAEEMNRVRSWVVDTFPGAAVEQETFHGQMRFSIPSSAVLERQRRLSHPRGEGDIGSAMGYLFVLFEENKDDLGIAHHSVSPTTLNQVFLSIV